MTTPTRTDVDQWRAWDAQRLDAMFRALGPAMHRGEVAAINTGLRVLERSARLLGLDAPPPVVEPPSTRPYADWTDEQLNERIAELEGATGSSRTGSPNSTQRIAAPVTPAASEK